MLVRAFVAERTNRGEEQSWPSLAPVAMSWRGRALRLSAPPRPTSRALREDARVPASTRLRDSLTFLELSPERARNARLDEQEPAAMGPIPTKE